MNKFKVGDKVVGNEKANHTYGITKKGYMGTVSRITSDNGIKLESGFYVDAECFDLVKTANNTHELHITCNDGKTTNAVYKVNGKIEKRTEAVCCPSDTFDFATGAQTAFDRVFPKAQPSQPIAPQEDKPKYKSGDRVKVVADTNFNRIVGEMVTLKTVFQNTSGSWYWSIAEKCVYIRESDVEPYTEPEQPKSKYENMSNDELKRLACGISELCCPTLSNKKRKSDCPFYHAPCEVTNENRAEIIQYLISENTPEPEKEPEPVYLTGKFVFVGENSCFTEGKPYVFENGNVMTDKSKLYYTESLPVETLEEANRRLHSGGKFIPYLGE